MDRGVASVLSKAIDFDILDANFSTYIAQNEKTVFAGIAQTNQKAVTERLSIWQRVGRVTTDVPTAAKLVTAGYTSAYAIARTPRASFLNAVADTLGSASAAEAVFTRAQQISATATAMVMNVRQALTGLMPRRSEACQAPAPGPQPLPPSFGNPTWQTLFGSLSSCSCPECQSVYSASAYFVDLLQFLSSSGALQALFDRRPDLPYIKLNCANTDTELPYVDLVNEIMESFVTLSSVAPKGAQIPIPAHDTPKSATAADLSVSPQFTQDDAYNKYLNTALYPPTLPFDRWLLTARTYLGFLHSSLYEVMETCQTGAAPASYSAPLATLPNIALPALVSYNPAAHMLIVTGAMTPEQEMKLLAASSDPTYTTAVNALYAASQTGAPNAPHSVPLATLAKIALSRLAVYDSAAHTLNVTGSMTPDAEKALLALSSDPAYQTAVTALYAASQNDIVGASPSRIALACEYLTISSAECSILTGKDYQGQPPSFPPSFPPALYQYYGYSLSRHGHNGGSGTRRARSAANEGLILEHVAN